MRAWAIQIWCSGILFTLAGCGGGGGGSASTPTQNAVPAGTITTLVSSNQLTDPKRVAYDATNDFFYVTAWNPDNSANDWILKITGAGVVSTYATLDSPIGIALNPYDGDKVYVTALSAAGWVQAGIGVASPIAFKYAVNHAGLAFGGNYAIAADFDEVKLVNPTTWAAPVKTVIAPVANGAVGGVTYGLNNKAFFSVPGPGPGADSIYHFDVTQTPPTAQAINLGGYALHEPYSLSVDAGGNLYVLNKNNAANNGEGALVKISDPTGTPVVTELVGANSGICGATAMTYHSGYLYVVNGTCQNLAHPKAKSILKIKT